MAHTQDISRVQGIEEVEDTKIKKESRFLFFKTEWWETVNTGHVGNDIYINTERPIENIYLNGKKVN